MESKLKLLLLAMCIEIEILCVHSANPNYFNIGGVLSSNSSQFYFKEIIAVSIRHNSHLFRSLLQIILFS